MVQLGKLCLGEIPMIDPELSDEFQLLLTWADEARYLGVRANADNPEDAKKALEFGAGGIGLMPYRAYVYGSETNSNCSRNDS